MTAPMPSGVERRPAQCQPVRYRGHSYPSTGWALPDIYREEPGASDGRCAEILGVSQQCVTAHRNRVGMPAAARRCPVNPYMERA